MPKSLIRVVSLFLVLALVADPATTVFAQVVNLSPAPFTAAYNPTETEALLQRGLFIGKVVGRHLRNIKSQVFSQAGYLRTSRPLRETFWGTAHVGVMAVPLISAQLGHVIGWPALLILMPLWMVSALTLHEAAHTYRISRTGGAWVDPSRVSLNPWAHIVFWPSVAKKVFWAAGPEVTRGQRAAFIASGPAINVLLGIAAGGLAFLGGDPSYYSLAGLHALLAGINLLPVTLREGNAEVPLDGAQLWELLWGGRSVVMEASGLWGVFIAPCAPMRIAEVNRSIARGLFGKRKPADDERRDRTKQAGQRFVQKAKGFARQLAEAGKQNSNVKTQIDADAVEHSASHAVQDAVDAAVQSRDFSEATFRLKVKERLVAQLRGHMNGGMTEDSEETVLALLSQLEQEGQTIGDLANAWQNEFEILKNLSELPAEELSALTSSGGHEHTHDHADPHNHSHNPGTHGHSHAITPWGLIRPAARWLARYFALAAPPAASPVPSEDVYAWLKSQVPELTDDEIGFLKAMTDDKKLQSKKPLTEQPELLARIINILNVPYGHKNSPLLFGKKGVGKSTALVLINQKMSQGILNGPMTQRRFLTLTGSLDPITDREKMVKLRDILIKTRGKIMLFVDEVHKLTRGRNDTTDFAFADILKEAMETGQITLIGATTIGDKRQYVDPDTAYRDRWIAVQVPEPTLEQVEQIVRPYKSYFEKEFGVEIAPNVPHEVVLLTDRYMKSDSFPRKAIDTLMRVVSKVSNDHNALTVKLTSMQQLLTERANQYIDLAKRGREDSEEGIQLFNQIAVLADDLKKTERSRAELGTGRVTVPAARSFIAEETGTDIPVEGQDLRKYLDAEAALHQHVVGQDKAVVAIAAALRRKKAGMKDPNRPAGSFIFIGPTGVGKTELARAVAAFEFGDEAAMLRLDMSEYMEKHNVSRLIGAPKGYIGHEEGGQLTNYLKDHPYSIVLWDEIEKAHPDVLNIMLQLLEPGRITDGKGNTSDATNTIQIMTSNLGMGSIQGALRKLRDRLFQTTDADETDLIVAQMNDLVEKAGIEGIRQAVNEGRLKPEFLNRIDKVVVFQVLTPLMMKKITQNQIRALVGKLLKEQGYDLTVEDNVYDHFAHIGYDPVNGARPLKRQITTLLVDPIATFILEQHAQGRGLSGGLVKLSLKEEDGKAAEVQFAFEEKAKTKLKRVAPSREAEPLIARMAHVVDSEQADLSQAEITSILGVSLTTAGSEPLDLGVVKLNTPFGFTPQCEQKTFNVNPAKKDGGMDKAVGQMTQLLNTQSADPQVLQVFNNWIEEFVRLAKSQTDGASVHIRWAYDSAKGLQVAVDQINLISPEIVQSLLPSLKPQPESDEQISEMEFAATQAGWPFRRSLLELKMQAAKIPGASFGLGGSQYWLQLPVPLPVNKPPTPPGPKKRPVFFPPPKPEAEKLKAGEPAGLTALPASPGTFRAQMAMALATHDKAKIQELIDQLKSKTQREARELLSKSARSIGNIKPRDYIVRGPFSDGQFRLGHSLGDNEFEDVLEPGWKTLVPEKDFEPGGFAYIAFTKEEIEGIAAEAARPLPAPLLPNAAWQSLSKEIQEDILKLRLLEKAVELAAGRPSREDVQNFAREVLGAVLFPGVVAFRNDVMRVTLKMPGGPGAWGISDILVPASLNDLPTILNLVVKDLFEKLPDRVADGHWVVQVLRGIADLWAQATARPAAGNPTWGPSMEVLIRFLIREWDITPGFESLFRKRF